MIPFIDSQKDKEIPGIALPVSPRSAGEALKTAADAADAGADLIEFRADFVEGGKAEILSAAEAAVRGAQGVPVLFTFRTIKEGGSSPISPEDYADLAEKAVRNLRIYGIDIELSQPSAPELLRLARRQKVKSVLSLHRFDGTPGFSEMTDTLFRMERMGADLAKCAYMPVSPGDAARTMGASAYASGRMGIPVLSISMGEMGRDSRVSGEIYGSSLTFGCLPGSESAPGQIEIKALRSELERVHEMRKGGRFVFLTGFMGSGKSSAGRMLSRMLGMPLLEMDEIIEKTEGRSVSAIFEADGQEYFRNLESRLIASFYSREPAVVSCGGGAVLRPENRALMGALGTRVLLTAEPETIYQRLYGRAGGRPNIRNRMSIEGITELMQERAAAYAEAADISVATDGRKTSEICRETAERLCQT